MAGTKFHTAGCTDDQVIAAGTDMFTKREFVRVATEIGIEREWDEVLVDVVSFDLGAGEPPGTIGRARASRSAERAAIGSGEDDNRLVLGNRAATCVRHVGLPCDVAPRAFAFARLNHLVKVIEFGRVDGFDEVGAGRCHRRQHGHEHKGGVFHFHLMVSVTRGVYPTTAADQSVRICECVQRTCGK